MAVPKIGTKSQVNGYLGKIRLIFHGRGRLYCVFGDSANVNKYRLFGSLF